MENKNRNPGRIKTTEFSFFLLIDTFCPKEGREFATGIFHSSEFRSISWTGDERFLCLWIGFFGCGFLVEFYSRILTYILTGKHIIVFMIHFLYFKLKSAINNPKYENLLTTLTYMKRVSTLRHFPVLAKN